MDNNTKYNILSELLARITKHSFIRMYSDGNVSLSMYVEDKQINLDGHYDIVYTCIKALYQEHGE